MNRFLLATLMAILPLSSTDALELPMSDMPAVPLKVEKGITYRTIGNANLRLDLAVPADGGPYPLVVCFHGGGWRGGDRRDLSDQTRDKNDTRGPSIIEVFASRGYAVATVSYRLVPTAKFPAPIEDAKTSIRFLRENAKRFNLNPEKICALGFSAGAHLALLLGTTDSTAGFDGSLYPLQSSKVQCVVSFFGPTDLSLYSATPGIEDAYMVPLLGKACKTDPDVYKKASPIDYVSASTVPTLMIHGTADLIVPIIHSERMLKKMQEVGARGELIKVKGEGHSWGGEAAKQSTEDATRFLDAELKGEEVIAAPKCERGRARLCRYLIVIFAFPLFAHGCHGEDDDLEPSSPMRSSHHETHPPLPADLRARGAGVECGIEPRARLRHGHARRRDVVDQRRDRPDRLG